MLSAVGVSHHAAPLLVRERIAFAESEIPRALPDLRSLPGVREALLLSTCNRTEAYLVTEDRPPVDAVVSALARLRGIARGELDACLQVRLGEDAARHVLRVAAGLDSMVVGEAQVLGQVRRAFGAARFAGTSGPVLNRLMQLAIASGRRVRSETALGRHGASVPHAVLALCRSVWGSTRGRRALIVGAGEMAMLTAKAFAGAGVRITGIANRTLESARVLARRYDSQALRLADVPQAATGADVLVVSVGAPQPILRAEELQTPDAPLLIVDIGVPRGVDPGVSRLPHVTLRDLDALAPFTAGGPPPEDLAAAHAIVDETLEAFVRWLGSRAAVPVIAALHRRAEAIVEEELTRAHGRLAKLDERERRAVRGVVEGALRKLLHAPFVRLRARGDDEKVLALARELFDLEGRAREEAS